MTLHTALDPNLHYSVLRDEAALLALRDDWTALEQQAATIDRYVTWSYVRSAWQHLRQSGDQLYVLQVRDGAQLVGVLPLVRVLERHHGLSLWVLRHIGIWEGERPGVLALSGPDRIWAGAWRFLARSRRDWQVLDLRELDAESWPVRELARPGLGFSARVETDVGVIYQRVQGSSWNLHEQQRREPLREQRRRHLQQIEATLPGLRLGLAESAEDIRAAFEHYLGVEQEQGSGTKLCSDPARSAFYRDWLPQLAERGEAQIWLMGDESKDIAALLRLRCGSSWIERHASQRGDYAASTPALLLALEALQRSYDEDKVVECSPVDIPTGSFGTQALLDWYDGRRPTRRLSVW
ncbi:MAG: hypothetical protein RJA44_1028, partial [Pseudomonadota bacterium]